MSERPEFKEISRTSKAENSRCRSVLGVMVIISVIERVRCRRFLPVAGVLNVFLLVVHGDISLGLYQAKEGEKDEQKDKMHDGKVVGSSRSVHMSVSAGWSPRGTRQTRVLMSVR